MSKFFSYAYCDLYRIKNSQLAEPLETQYTKLKSEVCMHLGHLEDLSIENRQLAHKIQKAEKLLNDVEILTDEVYVLAEDILRIKLTQS